MWPAAVHHGQWYRLLTAPFLHANIEHILFNMLTLAIVGSPVEAELGKVRFIALYLLSAVGGSVASYLLSHANVLGVGASGAIFGLMGPYFVLARRRKWEVGNILALIVVNLAIGFASSTIDWRAHLGGMITGAVVTIGLARSAEADRTAVRASRWHGSDHVCRRRCRAGGAHSAAAGPCQPVVDEFVRPASAPLGRPR